MAMGWNICAARSGSAGKFGVSSSPAQTSLGITNKDKHSCLRRGYEHNCLCLCTHHFGHAAWGSQCLHWVNKF